MVSLAPYNGWTRRCANSPGPWPILSERISMPSVSRRRKRTPSERFWAKVNRTGPTECWEWNGAMSNGYGVFNHVRGKGMRSHRYAYLQLVGPIPDGLVLDHLCRNRRCCNPAHLEPVSNRENILRGDSFGAVNARKTHCPQGHTYDEANTYVDARGCRHCRICRAAHMARHKTRHRPVSPLSTPQAEPEGRSE
jgi:hypothetical protein